MPIEIRELVIKATVNQDQNAAAQSSTANNENGSKEAELRDAVEEMLRILENKKER